MILEVSMRTTLAINEKLLEEVKALSGVRTKKEGNDFIEQRRKDVPHPPTQGTTPSNGCEPKIP
jgi:hypothetical protein